MKPIAKYKSGPGAVACPKQGWFTGKINGEDFYSDGAFIIIGKPIGLIASIHLQPDTQGFWERFGKRRARTIKPVAVDAKRVLFSDMKNVLDTQYYDFIIRKFPDVVFKRIYTRLGEKMPPPIRLESKGTFVGFVMPTSRVGTIPWRFLRNGYAWLKAKPVAPRHSGEPIA